MGQQGWTKIAKDRESWRILAEGYFLQWKDTAYNRTEQNRKEYWYPVFLMITIIINLIYIAQFDTNDILTALRSSWSSYARRRCLSLSPELLSSSAPPGCHRACPSVVSVLATCPASEHHAVGRAAVDVLQS